MKIVRSAARIRSTKTSRISFGRELGAFFRIRAERTRTPRGEEAKSASRGTKSAPVLTPWAVRRGAHGGGARLRHRHRRANRARRLFDSYRRRSIERASFLCENHVLERCLGSADAYRQSRSALVSHVTLE